MEDVAAMAVESLSSVTVLAVRVAAVSEEGFGAFDILRFGYWAWDLVVAL